MFQVDNLGPGLQGLRGQVLRLRSFGGSGFTAWGSGIAALNPRRSVGGQG